jgi:hypothetical protein
MTYLSGMSSFGANRWSASEAILYLASARRIFFIGMEEYPTWTTPDRSPIGSKAAKDGVHFLEDSCQPCTVSMAELHQTAPSNSRRSERMRTHCRFETRDVVDCDADVAGEDGHGWIFERHDA